MIALSPRLQAVLDLCQTLHTPEGILADIGTDHAYLPISAVQNGILKYAYACDLHPGPLAIAAVNIRNAGLTDKIETRLGDGLKPIDMADCIVIAGMGGMRIWGIINEGMTQAKRAKRLILQPQHDTVLLRKNLHSAGFDIQDERMVHETVGGKEHFYVVIAARHTGLAAKWTNQEYFLGKYLMANPGEAFSVYKKHERDKINSYIARISDEASLKNACEYLHWLR